MMLLSRSLTVFCVLALTSFLSPSISAQPLSRHDVSLEVICMRTPQILVGYPTEIEVIQADKYSEQVEISIAVRRWLKGDPQEAVSFRIKIDRWNREHLKTWITDQEEFLFFIPTAEQQAHWYFHDVFKPLHGTAANASFLRMLSDFHGTQLDLLKNTEAAIQSNRSITTKEGVSPVLALELHNMLVVDLPIDSRLTLAFETALETSFWSTSANFVTQLTTPAVLERVDRDAIVATLKKLAMQEKAIHSRTETKDEIQLHKSHPIGDATRKLLTQWDEDFDPGSIPQSSVRKLAKDASELETASLLQKTFRCRIEYQDRNGQPAEEKIPKLAQIKSLDFDRRSIIKNGGLPELSSLKAVRSVTGLNELEQVDLLSPLSDLKETLQHLEIRNLGAAVNLAPLKDLQQLRSLDLQGSHHKDYSALQSLKQLETLTLNSSNLQAIAELKDLTSLTVGHEALQDLSPLRQLTKLTFLSIDSQQPLDLAPLQGLTQLQMLVCNSPGVKSLEPLAGLVNLQQLHLDRTQVSNLSPLQSLSKLTLLSLRETPQLTDFQPLARLPALTELRIEDSHVADLSPLGKVKTLKRIFAEGVPANDVSGLADLEQLEYLWLGKREQVRGAEKLRYIDNLSNFTFGNRDHWQYKTLKLERKNLCDHAAPVMSKKLWEKCRQAGLGYGEGEANFTNAQTVLRRVGAMKMVAMSRADLYSKAKLGPLSERQISSFVRQENDFIAELVQRFEEVAGGFSVDPRAGYALQETTRCLNSGIFQFASLNLIGPESELKAEVEAILAACAKKQTPVLLHVDLQHTAATPAKAETFCRMLTKATSKAQVVIVPAKATPSTLENFLVALRHSDIDTENLRCCISGDWYHASTEDRETWKAVARTMRELGLDRFVLGSGLSLTRGSMFDQILKRQLGLNFAETRSIRSNVLTPLGIPGSK